MKFKDHLCLGATVYNGLYAGLHLLHIKILLAATPFIGIAYSRPADWHWLILQMCIFGAFCTGCAFPDTDVYNYPNGGHRMKSPFHNLTKVLIVYVATVVAVHLLSGFVQEAAVRWQAPYWLCLVYIPSAFMGGWLAHLAGDFLQGGIAWGFEKPKKIGCTGFKWDLYTDSFFGTFASLMNFIVSAVSWAAVFMWCTATPAIASACGIWVFSTTTYRSCNAYAAAGIASLFLVCAVMTLIRFI